MMTISRLCDLQTDVTDNYIVDTNVTTVYDSSLTGRWPCSPVTMLDDIEGTVSNSTVGIECGDSSDDPRLMPLRNVTSEAEQKAREKARMARIETAAKAQMDAAKPTEDQNPGL